MGGYRTFHLRKDIGFLDKKNLSKKLQFQKMLGLNFNDYRATHTDFGMGGIGAKIKGCYFKGINL